MSSEPLTAPHSFDLVRITKAKQVLGIHGDTIKAYQAEGFKGIYKRGKAVFVSKSELEAWIKANTPKVPPRDTSNDCSHCNGRGGMSDDSYSHFDCPWCGGTGRNDRGRNAK